jgi:hypothetical protein
MATCNAVSECGSITASIECAAAIVQGEDYSFRIQLNNAAGGPLDLCLYEMEGNNGLAEKMTPRTIVEIVEARVALKKLEVYEATLKQDGDTTLDEFKHRLDHISKHKMDDVKLKLVKKG